MANLTISVDEEVPVLGGYLREYARLDEVRRNRLAALDRLLQIADKNPIDRGGRRWSRDELHDR